ncbi:Lectin, galactoside-binding, soluble [Parelaphostrongylus tenuis]|uniref:Galectin n=1 Tax=Parelaphostrongylus tenuis TaxID=148309 RepID=A0AAD5LTH7_PARTN|nr:Lectin, galactoside-binding, soluble [Parelaphostrongylus tenuis]
MNIKHKFTIKSLNASAHCSGSDVLPNVTVRFDEGKIVCNSSAKSEWGKEERKSNPYKKGDDIDIRIRAHDSKYQIFVDQKELKECKRNLSHSSVTHFSIDGDVLITQHDWSKKNYTVNFACGLFDEKAIVRNSLIAGEWGNEEREGKIPFEKGVGFDLGIKNEEYAFQIFVNGERYATYAHRLDPHELNGLQIGGNSEVLITVFIEYACLDSWTVRLHELCGSQHIAHSSRLLANAVHGGGFIRP